MSRKRGIDLTQFEEREAEEASDNEEEFYEQEDRPERLPKAVRELQEEMEGRGGGARKAFGGIIADLEAKYGGDDEEDFDDYDRHERKPKRARVHDDFADPEAFADLGVERPAVADPGVSDKPWLQPIRKEPGSARRQSTIF